MLARVAASHLKQLDGKEVNGELSGEDHDKDEDADGGKAVHVFPVDRLHSFNQVRSWLLVLDLSLQRNKLRDSSASVSTSQFLKSGQSFVIPTHGEQPGRGVGQAEEADCEDGGHCNADGCSLARVQGQAKDVEEEGAKCYAGQGEEGELVEVLLLAKLTGEPTNCGQVSTACNAGEQSSKEEEGRGRRAGKEHPAKKIGKGEDEQGDPVAKLLTQLGGQEDPKKGPKPEDGTNP